MIKSIVEYVNFYFTTYKTQFYSDNFIKACLVYQFLYAKYFTQKLDIDQIIYRLTEARHYLNSNSNIIKIIWYSISLSKLFGNIIELEEDVFILLILLSKNVKYLVI